MNKNPCIVFCFTAIFSLLVVAGCLFFGGNRLHNTPTYLHQPPQYVVQCQAGVVHAKRYARRSVSLEEYRSTHQPRAAREKAKFKEPTRAQAERAAQLTEEIEARFVQCSCCGWMYETPMILHEVCTGCNRTYPAPVPQNSICSLCGGTVNPPHPSLQELEEFFKNAGNQ